MKNMELNPLSSLSPELREKLPKELESVLVTRGTLEEKTLILIRGIPGTGKTALGLAIAQIIQNPCGVYDSDIWFTEHGYPTRSQQNMTLAHLWCREQTKRCLSEGWIPIVTNTLCEQWEVNPYREIARDYKAKIVCISLTHVFKVDIPNISMSAFKKRWKDEVKYGQFSTEK